MDVCGAHAARGTNSQKYSIQCLFDKNRALSLTFQNFSQASFIRLTALSGARFFFVFQVFFQVFLKCSIPSLLCSVSDVGCYTILKSTLYLCLYVCILCIAHIYIYIYIYILCIYLTLLVQVLHCSQTYSLVFFCTLNVLGNWLLRIFVPRLY